MLEQGTIDSLHGSSEDSNDTDLEDLIRNEGRHNSEASSDEDREELSGVGGDFIPAKLQANVGGASAAGGQAATDDRVATRGENVEAARIADDGQQWIEVDGEGRCVDVGAASLGESSAQGSIRMKTLARLRSRNTTASSEDLKVDFRSTGCMSGRRGRGCDNAGGSITHGSRGSVARGRRGSVTARRRTGRHTICSQELSCDVAEIQEFGPRSVVPARERGACRRRGGHQAQTSKNLDDRAEFMIGAAVPTRGRGARERRGGHTAPMDEN